MLLFPLGPAVSKLLISNQPHAFESAIRKEPDGCRTSASSAVRQRRLASELRRLRRRAHLTGNDVATQLGWSEAKLSRIENGQARVKIADLVGFMDLYKVSGPHRAELTALAQESRQADSLEEIEGDLPEGYAQILQAESEAEAMLIWEPQVVPRIAAG